MLSKLEIQSKNLDSFQTSTLHYRKAESCKKHPIKFQKFNGPVKIAGIDLLK